MSQKEQDDLKRLFATWICKYGWEALLEYFGIHEKMPDGGAGWAPVKHWWKKPRNSKGFHEIVELFEFEFLTGEPRITIEQTEPLKNGTIICRPGRKFSLYMERKFRELMPEGDIEFRVPERKRCRRRQEREQYLPTPGRRSLSQSASCRYI